MKPWLRVSSLIFAALVSLTGCYEGFKHPPAGSGSGSGDQKGTGGVGQKPYGLVTVDIIHPSDAALADATCGGVQLSLVALRQAEMQTRIQGLTDYLSSQADVMRVIDDQIDLADCQAFSFSEIETRAVTAQPDPQASDALKAKLALHVRLVMWYGSGGNSMPSSAVLADNWQDITFLQTLGFTRVLSVNEFVMNGPQTGYIWNWKLGANPVNEFNADVVLNPNPDETGSNAVLTAAKQSGVNFSAWLTQRAQGL